jgi:TDG/mug DNA glycosylase family protein
LGLPRKGAVVGSDALPTLPDYLREGLEIVSIGINPSVNSSRAGFYFATPRNRFWRALNASGLAPETLEPGREAVEKLFHTYRIGFTDVAKRPSSSASHLTAEDFRTGAPLLRQKLLRCQPLIAWFHGKEAYGSYLRHADGLRAQEVPWGRQEQNIGKSVVFVTPNPSPANAAFSLDVLVDWYGQLARLRDELVRGRA